MATAVAQVLVAWLLSDGLLLASMAMLIAPLLGISGQLSRRIGSSDGPALTVVTIR
jgi:hypothetical protein